MATMTRDEIIKKLLAAGNKLTYASMYADVFLEYAKATENIAAFGLIVNHPRTGNPIDNPYLKIRDKALKKLGGLRFVNAESLWAELLDPSG